MAQYYQTPDGQTFVVSGDDDDSEFAIGEDFLIDGDDDDFGDDDDDDDDDDDEFGMDLIGDDDDDLDPIFGDDYVIGASRLARRRMSLKRKRKLARLRAKALARMAGGFSASRKRPVRQGYKLTLPFSQAFLAGATANITLTPQRSFRLNQLVVGNSNAALFQLNSLSVGQDNQFIAAGAINMEVFSNLSAQSVQLAGSTANLGTTIVLGCTNLDGVNPQTISGMLMGPTILQAA